MRAFPSLGVIMFYHPNESSDAMVTRIALGVEELARAGTLLDHHQVMERGKVTESLFKEAHFQVIRDTPESLRVVIQRQLDVADFFLCMWTTNLGPNSFMDIVRQLEQAMATNSMARITLSDTDDGRSTVVRVVSTTASK